MTLESSNTTVGILYDIENAPFEMLNYTLGKARRFQPCRTIAVSYTHLMTPTAVSQIVEQIFRVITMILLAQLFLPWGLEYASAGASLGALAVSYTHLDVYKRQL